MLIDEGCSHVSVSYECIQRLNCREHAVYIYIYAVYTQFVRLRREAAVSMDLLVHP